MIISDTYRVQFLSKKTGFWKDISIIEDNHTIQCDMVARKKLYEEYKLDGSRQYRLIHIEEDLIDCYSPNP